MGASIDEHKPMLNNLGFSGIGSAGAGHAHFRGGRGRSHTSLNTWLSKRWPLLLVGSIGAFYLLHWASSSPSPNTISTPMETAPKVQKLRSAKSMVKDGKVRLSDLIGAAIHLSEIAAHEITEIKLAGVDGTKVKGQTDEGVDEPVTLADARSNSVFVNGLRELFPGIDILSEETDPEVKEIGISTVNDVELEHDPWLDLKDLLVTVDPLDATKEFTENLLHFVTTMVCVVHKGKPIAGIINEPFAKDEAAIWGISLDEESAGRSINTVDELGRVSVESFNDLHGLQASLEGAEAAFEKVMISRSHTGAGANVVSELLPGKKPVFAGGSGYKALSVLKGEADAYVHVTKIKSWDVCAADAVVHAAGGMFTNLKGERLVYVKDDPMISGGVVATGDVPAHGWYLEKLAPVQMPPSDGHKKK